MSPIRENNRATGLFRAGLFLFLAGLAGWVIILHAGDTQRAWRVVLINFLYFTPLAAGLVTWSAIVIVSKGEWAGESEELAWTGFGFLVPSVIILAALWIGSPQWAPWHGAGTPQGFWLNNTFLFSRDMAAILAFWGCAAWYFRRRRKGRDPAVIPAAVLIIAYAIVFSLIGYDLAMALFPQWTSAGFGAFFFISGLHSAVVLWAFLAVLSPRTAAGARGDFGKLVIAFSILSAYFFYMQLLPIWYENLPRETSFIVARTGDPGWNRVSMGLIVLLYLAPVALLLTEWAKRNRAWLGCVSLLLLGGIWVQRWWLVMPWQTQQMHFGWVEAAGTAAVLGLAGLGTAFADRHLHPILDGGETP